MPSLWLRSSRHTRTMPGVRGRSGRKNQKFKLTHYRFFEKWYFGCIEPKLFRRIRPSRCALMPNRARSGGEDRGEWCVGWRRGFVAFPAAAEGFVEEDEILDHRFLGDGILIFQSV